MYYIIEQEVYYSIGRFITLSSNCYIRPTKKIVSGHNKILN